MTITDELAEALRAVVEAVKLVPAMNHHKFVYLGIQANNALNRYDMQKGTKTVCPTCKAGIKSDCGYYCDAPQASPEKKGDDAATLAASIMQAHALWMKQPKNDSPFDGHVTVNLKTLSITPPTAPSDDEMVDTVKLWQKHCRTFQTSVSHYEYDWIVKDAIRAMRGRQ